MGNKRNKLKKVFSPSQSPPTTDQVQDDDDLMNDLMAQLDSRDHTVQKESATVLNEMELNKHADSIESAQKQDAKSRFLARQARKAATLAQNYAPDDPANEARLQREAEQEEKDILRMCKKLDVAVHEINPDGHCLFSAVADQLAALSIIQPAQATYANVRKVASEYIFSHPDDFVPFLPSSSGEDGAGALDSGFMKPAEFEQYCLSIRDTAVWGGEPEILALSRAFNVPIHVIQSGSPPIVVHDPAGAESDIQDKKAVKISYHRRMYGLGEHYNSLRPSSKSSLLQHINFV